MQAYLTEGVAIVSAACRLPAIAIADDFGAASEAATRH